jgi:hypothetical protein
MSTGKKRAIDRNGRKALYWRRVKAGLCTRCGKEPARPGKRTCAPCASFEAACSRKYLARINPLMSKLGLCVCCHHREAMPGQTKCGVCSEYQVSHQKDIRAKRKEEGKCSGCGRKPTPGFRTCAHCRDKQREQNQRSRAKKKAQAA